MLRYSFHLNQWLVNLITASDNYENQLRRIAAKITEFHPSITAFVNNVSTRPAGIAVGEFELPLWGRNRIREKIDDYFFDISANSFFQTNSKGAAVLYQTVKRLAGLTGTESVIDVYSGTGSIAIYLSDAAKQVIGLEIIESAIADAHRNCILNSVSNCRFIQGDVRKTLPHIDFKPDVMILDPPRSGMHEDVIRQVCTLGPRRVIYVSCNPSTLARDLNLMNEHYAIDEIQPIDLFPNTYHIESVTKLSHR